MDRNVERLKIELTEIARKFNIPYKINCTTGIFTGFFSKDKVNNYETAMGSNRILYEKFFKLMLKEGIFFAPSPFEASFLTASHDEKELTKTIEAYEKIFNRLRRSK